MNIAGRDHKLFDQGRLCIGADMSLVAVDCTTRAMPRPFRLSIALAGRPNYCRIDDRAGLS
jgi:hypothetical protein